MRKNREFKRLNYSIKNNLSIIEKISFTKRRNILFIRETVMVLIWDSCLV